MSRKPSEPAVPPRIPGDPPTPDPGPRSLTLRDLTAVTAGAASREVVEEFVRQLRDPDSAVSHFVHGPARHLPGSAPPASPGEPHPPRRDSRPARAGKGPLVRALCDGRDRPVLRFSPAVPATPHAPPPLRLIGLRTLLRVLAHALGDERMAGFPADLGPSRDPQTPGVTPGVAALVRLCQSALARHRDHRFGSNVLVDALLDHARVRGLWRRLTAAPADTPEFYDGLALCLKRLGIPLDLLVDMDDRQSPWNAWCSGDKLLIVTGNHTYTVSCHGRLVQRPVMGARDVEAQTLFINGVHRHLRIEAGLETLPLSNAMCPAEADDLLRRLRARPDLGLLLCLGSDRTNPLTSPVARAIFATDSGHAPATSPVRFHFARPHHEGRPAFLTARDDAPPEDEGLSFTPPHGEPIFLPRINDGLAVEQALAGGFGPWLDAGLLLLDVRARPWLAVAAGHGGCGTVAAVLSLLQRPLELARQLDASYREGAFPGPGRVLQLIAAHRTKPTRAAADDFTFDHTHGWEVAWPRPRADAAHPLPPLESPQESPEVETAGAF